MTTTTLSLTNSTGLDANGNGTVVLRPDVNQNWAPLFVRISTASQKAPMAHCTLYHGAPGVPVQFSQYIDDTFLGSGDSSSMIAGTPVLFGEALIFTFTNGTPFDTAIASVYGMTSDLPPNLNLSPQVPGTHFAGHLSTEILQTIAKQSNSSPQHIGGINPPLTIGPFDTRQWGSYYLKCFGVVHAAATVTDFVSVTLTWYANPDGTDVVYQEPLEWVADSNSGSYVFTGSIVEFQDIHHGPYLSLLVTNSAPGPNDVLDFSYTLTFTTRVIGSPYQKQQQGADGTLSSSVTSMVVGAGATLVFPNFFSYGRASIDIANVGAGSLNINRFLGSLPQIEGFSLASGVSAAYREVILPKRSQWWTINAPGVASSFVMKVWSLFDKV